jgi:hypothetical protein
LTLVKVITSPLSVFILGGIVLASRVIHGRSDVGGGGALRFGSRDRSRERRGKGDQNGGNAGRMTSSSSWKRRSGYYWQ